MVYAVILAGGTGTRFWPLSRELYPKQFLKISGTKTLLEETVHRLDGLVRPDDIYIVANEKNVHDISWLFSRSGERTGPHIMVEPVGRNTAPAIGLSAAYLVERDPDAVMIVLPADHMIRKTSAFRRILRQAAAVARGGGLLTLGIRPSSPETGYGYIRRGALVRRKGLAGVKVYDVDGFYEKPDTATARRYLKSKRYLWNSGIFVWKASAILQEIERYLPQLHKQLLFIREARGTPGEAKAVERAYKQMDSVSIDYGVMEKAKNVMVIEADIGWTDLGSWTAVKEVVKPDRMGNVMAGNVYDLGSRNSVVYADRRLVATIGLDQMIVVDTPDATLVCARERAQDVKALVTRLKEHGAQEQYVHRTVFRPWGSYTVLEEDRGYKIKRLVVNPGARLSLQLHRHRSEHWVVVSGVARVTCGERVYDVKVNESTFIPMGTRHRIENPAQEPLQIIEVQNGSYVGEDDIVRFDDDYGRTGKGNQV